MNDTEALVRAELGRQGLELRDGHAVGAVFLGSKESSKRFFEFFTARIRNPNTRRAYLNAARAFAKWCHGRGLELARVEPFHVAAWVEELGRRLSKPTVKQHLAAVRMLFDWLLVGQVVKSNPASPVRGPKYSTRKGKTAVLAPDEMRALLESIETKELIGLRDRALIGVMSYTFARVGAVLGMRVGDYFVQRRRGWVRLNEKGGKVNEMPCNHNLEKFLEEWLEGSGLRGEPEHCLFPTFRNGVFTEAPLSQRNVHHMIRRRALAAGIQTKISCHTFRATGITTYLQNGGRLEVAQQMAAHESPRTTGLYDRRSDQVALDEVERIVY